MIRQGDILAEFRPYALVLEHNFCCDRYKRLRTIPEEKHMADSLARRVAKTTTGGKWIDRIPGEPSAILRRRVRCDEGISVSGLDYAMIVSPEISGPVLKSPIRIVAGVLALAATSSWSVSRI